MLKGEAQRGVLETQSGGTVVSSFACGMPFPWSEPTIKSPYRFLGATGVKKVGQWLHELET